MTENTNEPTLVPFEATYIGRRINSKDKVVYAYRDERDGGIASWTKPLVRPGTVGAVYRLHEVGEGSGRVRTSGESAPRYVRSLPYTDPNVVEWRAADEAVAVEQSRVSAIRRAGDPWDEVEQLVGRAASGLTRPQRRALAVRLMEVLWA